MVQPIYWNDAGMKEGMLQGQWYLIIVRKADQSSPIK